MKIKRAASISLCLKGKWVEGQCRKTRTEKCHPSLSPERHTPWAASWQACTKILAAAEETVPYAARCTELPSACALQQSSALILGGLSQLPTRSGKQSVCSRSYPWDFLMVAITPTGIHPSGKTELSKRNGASLVLWALFTELKDWCNLLKMSLVGLHTRLPN